MEENRPRVVRDKPFAERLEEACIKHPQAPSGRGRQVWVREELKRVFGLKVSPEAVRKWFAGEARPKPQMMKKLARVLDTDEGHLSLGLDPAQAAVPQFTNGAAAYVAGLILMDGGSVAFETDARGTADFRAIIKNKLYQVSVLLGQEAAKGGIEFKIPRGAEKNTVVGVVRGVTSTSCRLLALRSALLAKHGRSLVVEWSAGGWWVDRESVDEILEIDDLEGEPLGQKSPKPKKKRPR